MLLSEPTAARRVVAVKIYGFDGNGIDPTYTWLAGDVKLSKNGGALTNTTNLPVNVGSKAGLFTLALATAEIDTVGYVLLVFSPSTGVEQVVMVPIDPAEYSSTDQSALQRLNTDVTTARAAKIDNLDTTLSSRATPTQARDALLQYAHDTGVTIGGLFQRLEALITGKMSGANATGTAKFYLKDGVTVAFQAVQNVLTGIRNAATITNP